MNKNIDAVALLRDEVATAAEHWANTEYADAESRGAGGPVKTEECAKAEDKFRTLLDKLADRAATVAKDGGEGYILARETVVELPDGSKALGYTLLSGVGIFTRRQEVSDAIAELSLPLGWVSMTTNQLLPGWMLPTPKPEASAATQPWRDAVLDQCAIAHMPFHEDDPRKTLEDLISWHVEVSHDPAVSDRAATQQAGNYKLQADEKSFYSRIGQSDDGLPFMTDSDMHGVWDIAMVFKISHKRPTHIFLEPYYQQHAAPKLAAKESA